MKNHKEKCYKTLREVNINIGFILGQIRRNEFDVHDINEIRSELEVLETLFLQAKELKKKGEK